MLQGAEIKEQINDGDIDELQELNEKICRLLRKLESLVDHGSRRNVGWRQTTWRNQNVDERSERTFERNQECENRSLIKINGEKIRA